MPETQFDYWSNWGHLYRPLIAASQVSDARDLVIASIEAEGALNTWRIMFQMNIHAPHAFNRLLGDWNMEHYDESTYLAILDILVSVICDLCSFSVTLPEREHLTTAERCLQHAHSVAICLKERERERERGRTRAGIGCHGGESIAFCACRDHAHNLPACTALRHCPPKARRKCMSFQP